jgi:hypothetical protein
MNSVCGYVVFRYSDGVLVGFTRFYLVFMQGLPHNLIIFLRVQKWSEMGKGTLIMDGLLRMMLVM